MASFSQICRFSNCLIGNYKTVFHGRSSLGSSIICNYTRKSAEQKLGLDRPKRPLTPFFKFMSQMRPALLAKNPGISAKEAVAWTTKHWQQLDAETKAQMSKEYEKDREDYKKIKALYEASLTQEQKADILRVKEEMAEAREKRKLKAETKELGKPKKPMSSYFIFTQTKKHLLKGSNIKDYQEALAKEWATMPQPEKVKYEKQAQELFDKYRKDLEAWELKMVSMGRTDLVRVRSQKPKAQKKSE